MGSIFSASNNGTNLMNYAIFKDIVTYGPSVIDAACEIFTDAESNSLKNFLTYARRFDEADSHGQTFPTNILSGIEVFALFGVTFDQFNDTNEIYTNAFEGLNITPFKDLSAENKKYFAAYVALVSILQGVSTNGGVALFSLLRTNSLRLLFASGNIANKAKKINIFENAINKIKIPNGFGVPFGKNILIIITTVSVLTSGLLKRIFPQIQNSCGQNTTNNLPANLITGDKVPVIINCGLYISLECTGSINGRSNFDLSGLILRKAIGNLLPFTGNINSNILLRNRDSRFQNADYIDYEFETDEDLADDDSSSNNCCSSSSSSCWSDEGATELITDGIAISNIPSYSANACGERLGANAVPAPLKTGFYQKGEKYKAKKNIKWFDKKKNNNTKIDKGCCDGFETECHTYDGSIAQYLAAIMTSLIGLRRQTRFLLSKRRLKRIFNSDNYECSI